MRRELHWDFRDVFRAARLGFSVKKIWIMLQGILLGWIVYLVLAYIAFILSGYTFSEIWSEFHYLPIPWGVDLTFWGKVLIGLAIFLDWIIYFIFGTAVTKVTIEQLRGDEFYEVKKALNYGFKHGKSAVGAVIALALAIILILIGGVILGLIGKIPWFGELVLLILAIPVIFTVLFMLYLGLSMIVALYIAPASAGTTGSDTFDTLFEAFSTLNDQAWRFVVYEILLYGTKILFLGIFAYFVGRTLAIIHAVLSLPFLMGQKFVNISYSALSYLPNIVMPNEFWNSAVSLFTSITKTDFILYPPTLSNPVPLPQAILGFLFGILLYIVIFVVLSYWGTMHFTGNTLIFAVILKKKDDINLLETKPESELEAETEEITETTKEEIETEEKKEGEEPQKESES